VSNSSDCPFGSSTIPQNRRSTISRSGRFVLWAQRHPQKCFGCAHRRFEATRDDNQGPFVDGSTCDTKLTARWPPTATSWTTQFADGKCSGGFDLCELAATVTCSGRCNRRQRTKLRKTRRSQHPRHFVAEFVGYPRSPNAESSRAAFITAMIRISSPTNR
jgi:hypothetical protein